MSKILNDLGYYSDLDNYIQSKEQTNSIIGRVIKQGRQSYQVKTDLGNYNSKISGKLRHKAKQQSDYPVVGDWVLAKNNQENNLIIHEILPRKTTISRKAINRFGKKQTIAANVDFSFVIQDIANDFNLNRLDRLIAICFSSNVTPFIIFTKIDLIATEDINSCINTARNRFNDIPIILLSNKTMLGLKDIVKNIQYGRTYCFIGASGAGKSSLINHLVGSNVMPTKKLKENNKGQHTTSHRELFIISNSGILIDTPGMRELGVTDSNKTLESTFKIIFNLSKSCKFSNCSHVSEPKCAVVNALNNNEILKSYYDNFHKMKREQEQYKLNKRGLIDKEMVKVLKSDSKKRKA